MKVLFFGGLFLPRWGLLIVRCGNTILSSILYKTQKFYTGSLDRKNNDVAYNIIIIMYTTTCTRITKPRRRSIE